MTTSEKVAYLKGLAEGLGLDTETKEGKLISVIIDVLEDIALDIEDLEDGALDLWDEIDELSDDLTALEDEIYDEDDDEDDHHHHHSCCSGCGDHDHPILYEVTCPACESQITVDEDILETGSVQCPSCGETLEFDLDSLEDEDEDEE